eukprot:3025523-Karenia_brevis.AAC.1
MIRASRSFSDQHKFKDEEIRRLRHHGAKPTLTSAAQHYGADRRAVRHQGGWKGDSEDAMPDTYMRRAMTLALKLQEDCLTMIQKSGTLPTDSAPSSIENVNADKPDDAPEDDVVEVASTPTCTPSSTDTESSEPALSVIVRDTSEFR